MITFKLIKTDLEYQLALTQLEEFFDAKIGTKEGDYADVLALLIDEYEQKQYFIEALFW